MKTQDIITFSSDELKHYNRHLMIPEIGLEGQKKLKMARVLVVGTGGLGAPMLQYLAAAGVGTIGLVDFDKVESSNLHRQILFGVSDVGLPKVEVAAARLKEINPYIQINLHNTRLTSSNALDILKGYDIVADGTDNFPARYLINDASVMLDIPNVHGSIYQFEGQVSVFNYTDKEGNLGPDYRDLFPVPPPPNLVPNCAEAGVLGVLPGIIGSLQANEVIKLITGAGEPLSGKLFIFNALDLTNQIVNIPKNLEKSPITGLIDYDTFCGFTANGESQSEYNVSEMSVQEFKASLDRHEEIQLIDVREPYEYEIAQMGGLLIPLKSLPGNIDKIRRDIKVVIHCRSGKRSAKAINQLQEQYGFGNLYNLKGGILAWADEIDTSISQY